MSFYSKPQAITRWLGFGLAVFLVFGIVGSAAADGLSQGYLSSDTALKAGMAVELDPSANTTPPSVKRATAKNADHIIGVATTGTDNQVVLTSGKPEVYVQTSGDVAAAVADINGTVKKGDLITISPLNGVLMRADSTSTVVLGIALEDFVASEASSYQIQTDTGKKQVLVADLSVNLDPHAVAQGATQAQPDSLQRLGRAITGHDVGEVRVLIALVIFLLVLVSEGGIIYGAITSSISALGRNPLAGKMIRRELVRVLLVASLVLSIGLGAIYGVLWV